MASQLRYSTQRLIVLLVVAAARDSDAVTTAVVEQRVVAQFAAIVGMPLPASVPVLVSVTPDLRHRGLFW